MEYETMALDPFAAGRRKLEIPALPLVRLLQLLYLTGPFETVAAVLKELPEPLKIGEITYPRAGALLRPHLPNLREFERLKRPSGDLPPIYDEKGGLLDSFEALELWVSQQVLTRELEEINSLLCEPCGCTLCCIGPDAAMRQDFFEIPLTTGETRLFSLPVVDTRESRGRNALSEPPLAPESSLFHEDAPGLYHWQNGWSLILPRGSACPQLENTTGRCLVYGERPEVCRRPQIFPYVIEPAPERDRPSGAAELAAYAARRKLLAIWDCLYVRELKEEIVRYAELSGLEPIFRRNKD
jgi:Fe-S-cluster containining protein